MATMQGIYQRLENAWTEAHHTSGMTDPQSLSKLAAALGVSLGALHWGEVQHVRVSQFQKVAWKVKAGTLVYKGIPNDPLFQDFNARIHMPGFSDIKRYYLWARERGLAPKTQVLIGAELGGVDSKLISHWLKGRGSMSLLEASRFAVAIGLEGIGYGK